MDSAAIVSAVNAESGLDATAAQALAWVNEVYQSAVAGARWLLAEYTAIGPTVANQDTYVLADASVVQVEGLMVNAVPYRRVGTQEVWDLKASNTTLNVDGVYAPDFTATGAARVILYPAPSASGQVINALVALEATALDGTSGTTPVVPPEFHQNLVDLAIALGRARLNGDQQSRQEFAAGLDQLTTDLRRDKHSEVSGVVRVDMSGF